MRRSDSAPALPAGGPPPGPGRPPLTRRSRAMIAVGTSFALTVGGAAVLVGTATAAAGTTWWPTPVSRPAP